MDLRAVVDDYANREGFDVPAALWRIMRTLLERAEAGDQNAAKLVLDRLCGSVAEAAGLAFRMESRNGQSLEELLARSWKIEVVTGVSEPSPVSK